MVDAERAPGEAGRVPLAFRERGVGGVVGGREGDFRGLVKIEGAGRAGREAEGGEEEPGVGTHGGVLQGRSVGTVRGWTWPVSAFAEASTPRLVLW